jgi:hypothetical protein
MSSYSGGTSNDCVEVAFDLTGDETHLRDSKDPAGGAIKISREGWAGLLKTAQDVEGR